MTVMIFFLALLLRMSSSSCQVSFYIPRSIAFQFPLYDKSLRCGQVIYVRDVIDLTN